MGNEDDGGRMVLDGMEQIAVDDQRAFWNSWNAAYREKGKALPEVNARQASLVLEWISGIGRRDLQILEVGCGSGWLCEKLLDFGNVVGTDLSDEVLARAQARVPKAKFISGDFLSLDFEEASADVVVSLEVLAHVGDQAGLLAKIAHILRPGGWLILATQNRFALERWTEVPPRGRGQIRHWISASELRALLQKHFSIRKLTSIEPVGNRGVLRWVNAPKVSRALGLFLSQEKLVSLKERLYLGHTLMALAQKPHDQVLPC